MPDITEQLAQVYSAFSERIPAIQDLSTLKGLYEGSISPEQVEAEPRDLALLMRCLAAIETGAHWSAVLAAGPAEAHTEEEPERAAPAEEPTPPRQPTGEDDAYVQEICRRVLEGAQLPPHFLGTSGDVKMDCCLDISPEMHDGISTLLASLMGALGVRAVHVSPSTMDMQQPQEIDLSTEDGRRLWRAQIHFIGGVVLRD